MLKALLKKQFLELNTFYFQNRKTGKNRSKGGIIGMIALFILLFISIGFAIYGMGSLLADAFIFLNLDWLYFALMGIMAIFLGVFGGVFNTYAGLYHAKDNELLLSMPIPPSKILFVRMFGVYAMGLLYESLVFVPAAICFWVKKPPTAAAAVFTVLLVFVIGFLVLALTCLLGWIVALISSKLKNKSFITVILSLAFLGLYYFFYFKLNTILTEIVQNAVLIGNTIESKVWPLYQLGLAACGNVLPMLIFTALTAVIFAVTYFALSRSFMKIATTKQAEKKTVYEEKTAKQSKLSSALLRKELKHFLSSPTYMMNGGLGIIIMPVLGVTALLKSADIEELIGLGSIFLPELSDLLPVFAVCAICMIASMDAITAPSVSLEGKSIWIVQSMPVDPWAVLQAKQSLHIYLNTPPAVITAILVGIALKADIQTVAFMTVFVLTFILLSSAFGLLANLKNPNLSWTNETVPIKQGMSVVITLFGGWIIAAGFGVGAYFLREKIDMTYYMIGAAVIFALAARIINSWLKKKGTEIFAHL